MLCRPTAFAVYRQQSVWLHWFRFPKALSPCSSNQPSPEARPKVGAGVELISWWHICFSDSKAPKQNAQAVWVCRLLHQNQAVYTRPWGYPMIPKNNQVLCDLCVSCLLGRVTFQHRSSVVALHCWSETNPNQNLELMHFAHYADCTYLADTLKQLYNALKCMRISVLL